MLARIRTLGEGRHIPWDARRHSSPALSACLLVPSLPLLVLKADILGSPEHWHGAQSDSFHDRRKMSLEERAAKLCTQRPQEGGVSRQAAPPWGTEAASGSLGMDPGLGPARGGLKPRPGLNVPTFLILHFLNPFVL